MIKTPAVTRGFYFKKNAIIISIKQVITKNNENIMQKYAVFCLFFTFTLSIKKCVVIANIDAFEKFSAATPTSPNSKQK